MPVIMDVGLHAGAHEGVLHSAVRLDLLARSARRIADTLNTSAVDEGRLRDMLQAVERLHEDLEKAVRGVGAGPRPMVAPGSQPPMPARGNNWEPGSRFVEAIVEAHI